MGIRMSRLSDLEQIPFSRGVSPFGMGRISGLSVGIEGIGALNPGELPVSKAIGDYLRIPSIQYTWQGPETRFWLCAGLKKGYGDFNNGAILVGGYYAVTMFTAPPRSTSGVVEQTLSTPLAYSINSGIPTATYDAYVWVIEDAKVQSLGVSAFLDDRGFTLIDVDASVVRVVAAGMGGFNARWQ
ncbi:MAG: hypothetical protein Q8O76_13200 [Chloroflexota bacterium]|nr:hypothetical protein [Chloroflexota bacterium]